MKLEILAQISLSIVSILLVSQITLAQNAYGLSDITYDPVSKKVTTTSITALDYQSALYFDPAVSGDLYEEDERLEIGYDTGSSHTDKSFVKMQNLKPASTDVLYEIYSEHYVIPYFKILIDNTDENQVVTKKTLWFDPLGLSRHGGGASPGAYKFRGSKKIETYDESRYFHLGTTGAALVSENYRKPNLKGGQPSLKRRQP